VVGLSQHDHYSYKATSCNTRRLHFAGRAKKSPLHVGEQCLWGCMAWPQPSNGMSPILQNWHCIQQLQDHHCLSRYSNVDAQRCNEKFFWEFCTKNFTNLQILLSEKVLTKIQL